AFGVPRRQVAQQQLRVAEDGRQQVVEVMRNAAGELAHGLHLLRLAELLLEVALIADVALRAPDAHQVAVFDEADDVIEKNARPAIPGTLPCFRIRYPVTRANEAADLLAIGR